MLRFKTLMRTPPDSVYTEPSTGYKVPWVTSFQDCLDKVKEHRELHGIQLTEGWEREVESQLAMTLKVSDPENWIEDTEKPYIPRLVAYGRALWAELHAYALAYPENPDDHQKAAAQAWFAGWVARIPSAKCDCAYRWAKLGLTPDFSDRRSFYLWSVAAHDRVREHLGQTIMGGEFRHLV